MEPIPQTREAMEKLHTGPGQQDDLLRQLLEQADRVREIVPDCLGISVASAKHDLTFTVVASAEEIALMDALQYLDGGPCVDGAKEGQVVEVDHADLMDEERWRTFARATAARGVASTLTLPILADGEVVGSVNLYGGSGRSFSGHHEALARIFDAWAAGAVTNADLGFTSRRRAEQAPERLRDETFVDVAIGMIVDAEGVEPRVALDRLTIAAELAGVSVAQLARELIDALDEDQDQDQD